MAAAPRCWELLCNVLCCVLMNAAEAVCLQHEEQPVHSHQERKGFYFENLPRTRYIDGFGQIEIFIISHNVLTIRGRSHDFL